MEGVILSVSKDELKVYINESIKEAFESYETARAKHDRFSHLPQYLSKKQTAELFGVSVGSIGNWVKNNWLEQVKLGRHCRFERDTIVKLILNGGLTKYRGLTK